MGDSEHEDDGLTWAEDGLDASSAVPGSPSTTAREDEDESAAETGLAAVDQLPAGTLIGYGAVLGVFFVYTLSWVSILIRRLATPPQPLLDGVDRVQLLVGIAAPALWVAFGVVFVRRRAWYWQTLWLVLGLLLLAPWPWILTLIAASTNGGAQ